ncbi:MAG: hypothetical protein ABSE49_12745 [Polyangiaceae bacterium]
MRKTGARHNRKLLIAVPLVWCAVAGLQAVASADGGTDATDAGTDASAVGPAGGKTGTCSVAGTSLPFGAGLGAGCC